MFTVKDLEVYKDAIKEKKNRATITGEKPLKTPPSLAKISKLPLKLQNEEPNKERKPLSVVHKASNTIKDPHKPPSPTPVGTSKLKITSKSPSPGKLHPIEANSLAKASDIKSEPLKSPRDTVLPKPTYIKPDDKSEPHKSPRETSLPKPTYVKPDDNKIVGVRKLKEPTSHGATNVVYQKSPSLSGVKVAPAVNVNASLCSECTRAASEGAVCFIGNDGRVSACTTRSAVRLCKNLNCAANNPEYVAAMANAPKKYLISKRHLLKAQFGLKSKSSRSKSPNSQQIGAAGINGWDHSSDALSPSNGDMSALPSDMSTANFDTSLNNFALESEDGELSPVNGSSRLFDGDMSLLNGNDAFCEGEMGLMNDYATAEQGIAKNKDDINELKEFSFLEGVAGETDSPKFSPLESSKDHIEGLSESNGCNDANPHADAESFKLANVDELDDVDAYGCPIQRASDADMSSMTAYQDIMSPNDMGEQADKNAQSGDMASLIGVSQAGDENQISNVVPTTDISQVPDDDQTGDTLENDEQIRSVASAVDINQVTGDMISIINTNQLVHNYDKGGDLTPIGNSQAGDDGDSTSSFATHVEHNNQSDGTDNTKDDGQSVDNNDDTKADNACGDDILSVNSGHAGDDILLLNNALSGIITSSNGGPITDDDQGDASTSLKDEDIADDDQCDDVMSPHSTHLMDGNVMTSLYDTQVADDDQGDYVPSPHSKHVADNEESDETAFLHDKQVAEDGLSHGLTSLNDRCVADDDESDEDDNEDNETDEIVKDICVADNNSSIDLQKGLESAEKNMGSGGEDGSVTSSSTKKVIKQRRRRILNVVESSNPEMVTLRKQQTQERKQAEEWMLNYAIEGVVHKLAPSGEAKVKILVEAFESIISHTDVEGSDTHNASKEKHTLT